MEWLNDRRSVKERFEGPFNFHFEKSDYIFRQEVQSLTTVYDAVCSTQSIVLGTYIVQQYRDSLSNISVLELGAGAGLPSILVAASGARRVLATDLGSVLPALRSNIEGNRCENIECLEYAWYCLRRGDDVSVLGPPFDLILASDVVYDFEYFPHLTQSLIALADASTTIYLSYRDRYSDVQGWLFDEFRPYFTWEEVSDRHTIYSHPEIHLFRIRKLG